MGKKTDLTGKVFDNWTVLYRSEVRGSDNRKKYICECSCGTIKEVDGRHLTRGSSKSCGCEKSKQVSERFLKHGMIDTPTYRAWAGMKQRCTNPSYYEYHHYGGRGIQVLSGWEDFQKFFEDMGEAPAGMTLDRIDVNGHYSKENCRWTDKGTQSHGRRKMVYKNSKTPSRFIGVTWQETRGKWRVKLVFAGKVVLDRTFFDDIEAAKLYDEFSLKYYSDEPNKEILKSLTEK